MDLFYFKVLYVWIFFLFLSKNVEVKKKKKFIVFIYFDILGKLVE